MMLTSRREGEEDGSNFIGTKDSRGNEIRKYKRWQNEGDDTQLGGRKPQRPA